MEKLNELFVRAKAACSGRTVGYMEKVNPHTILAIAEAFRALEKRAEAAEARLAELEKQKPVAQFYKSKHGNVFNTLDGWSPLDGVNELFTRPAPAINLAELIPDAMPNGGTGSPINTITHWCDGYNSCRAEMLRKIEEKPE